MNLLYKIAKQKSMLHFFFCQIFFRIHIFTVNFYIVFSTCTEVMICTFRSNLMKIQFIHIKYLETTVT